MLGGPPIAARRLHRLDQSLYQKRAEEEFLRKQKRSSEGEKNQMNTDSSLILMDLSGDVSPSVSCSEEAGGFVVNTNTNLVSECF